jgi:uncharacterized protein YraI
MKKRIVLSFVVILLVASMLPLISASALIGPQYVSTENGKGLYMRSGPSKDFAIIITIPNAAMLDYCQYYNAAWSYVTYGNYAGYCMSRYLSSTKPSVNPTPTPTAAPSGDVISYKNFVKADYYVTVRPSTPSGFVNLRWAPSKTADVRTIYYAGSLLRVLAQDSGWAQVYDEGAGICGFMMRSYLSTAGDGYSIGQ